MRQALFDNQSVAFLMMPGLVAALLTQLVNWRVNGDMPGVKWWSVGMALQAAGVLIRAQNPPIPDVVTFPLINLMLVGGQFVMLYGLCQFCGRPMFVKSTIASLVVIEAGLIYFTAVEDSLFARTALFAAGLAISCGLQFSLLPSIAKREGVAGVLVLVVSYGLILVGVLLRVAGIGIFGDQAVGALRIGESLALNGRQAVTSLLATAITTGFSYGYIMLVASRSRWQLRQLATSDALTGLPNRRAFDTEVPHAVSRVRRDTTRLGLALFDLDRFKRVNDTHGHAVGDQVLRHFATVVRGALRETDFFARIGGEEFALMVTDDSIDSIYRAAERIRAAIDQSSLPIAGSAIHITISAGTAVGEPGEGDFDRLYQIADEALYRAKAEGRNRVERAGGAEPSAAAATEPAATEPATAPSTAPAVTGRPGIFTIGDESQYDAALTRGHAGDGVTPITKRGPYKQADGTTYFGGYAFETGEAAFAYIDKLGKRGAWAVYEMDAAWPADVWHAHATEDFMRLARDAVLLRKVGAEDAPVSEPLPELSDQRSA